MLPGFFSRLLFICLALALAPLPAYAVSPVVVADDVRVDLGDQLAWWPDVPEHVGLAEVRAAPGRFVGTPPGPAFGMHRQPAWFRVELLNTGAARNFLLEAAFAKLDYLDVWVVHADGRVEGWSTGEARGYASRAIPSPRFLFPVSLAADEQATLFLRVQSSTVINLPLVLHDERAYLQVASSLRGWLGAFYGLILGLLAYNAFVFYTTRDRAFLHYATGGFLAVGYFASIDGYAAAFLPAHPALAQQVLFLCGSLSVTFTLLFTRGFLELRALAPRLDRVLVAVAITAAVATALVPVMPGSLAMACTIMLSLAMAVLMTIAGLLSLRTGFRPARWFVLAISVHLVVLSLVSLGALGVVAGLFEVADIAHRVGFVLNLVCFTLALGDRIRVNDEHRRLAEESAREAAAQVRARNEFLSTMSHELRTPMTGVLGMAELLEHTDLAPQQRRYLSTLRYSGEMLLTLINDVLDHARIEAGRLQLRREAFDLLRLIDECRMLFEQQPRDNGVILAIDLGPGVSRVVVGDAQRVKQVMVNLLAHAFRATTTGRVVLRVRTLEGAGWLRFEVEGGSAGISQAATARLFDEFSSPVATGRSHSGPTLGLVVSRQLCELMGGRIGVHGVRDDGTLFWFELPLHAAG